MRKILGMALAAALALTALTAVPAAADGSPANIVNPADEGWICYVYREQHRIPMYGGTLRTDHVLWTETTSGNSILVCQGQLPPKVKVGPGYNTSGFKCYMPGKTVASSFKATPSGQWTLKCKQDVS